MKKILSFSSTNTPKFAFFVCTTKKESEQAELPLVQSLLKMDLGVGCRVSVDVFAEFENTHGLSQRYNEFIDYCKGNYSYLALVHDDITIRDALIFDKIIQTEQMGADVIAAVGSTFWGVPFGHDIQSQPLIWTKAACGNKCSGFMLHTIRDKDGNKTPYALPSSYGPAPMQVLVADGCFMCFTRKAIQAGLRWSEDFTWHFYDMDCSLQCNAMGLKMMTAPILLQHDSMGQSVIQPEFMLAQKRFIDKWRNRQ